MMKPFIALLLLVSPIILNAQPNPSVTIVDLVKVTPGYEKEAIFYYEQNWKLYRDIALARGVIKSYRVLLLHEAEKDSFNLMLITEYADSAAYHAGEKRFEPILKEARPNGPLLLNAMQPAQFRRNYYYRKSETLFESRHE